MKQLIPLKYDGTISCVSEAVEDAVAWLQDKHGLVAKDIHLGMKGYHTLRRSLGHRASMDKIEFELVVTSEKTEPRIIKIVYDSFITDHKAAAYNGDCLLCVIDLYDY